MWVFFGVGVGVGVWNGTEMGLMYWRKRAIASTCTMILKLYQVFLSLSPLHQDMRRSILQTIQNIETVIFRSTHSKLTLSQTNTNKLLETFWGKSKSRKDSRDGESTFTLIFHNSSLDYMRLFMRWNWISSLQKVNQVKKSNDTRSPSTRLRYTTVSTNGRKGKREIWIFH